MNKKSSQDICEELTGESMEDMGLVEACEENDEAKGEDCMVCGKFVPGFEYQMCCNAFDCGCMGKPIYPCVCSEECYNKLLKGKS